MTPKVLPIEIKFGRLIQDHIYGRIWKFLWEIIVIHLNILKFLDFDPEGLKKLLPYSIDTYGVFDQFDDEAYEREVKTWTRNSFHVIFGENEFLGVLFVRRPISVAI